ncbi:MAG TPA: hypothetical protein VF824_20340 [Thermoanaerobaculia bacterium]
MNLLFAALLLNAAVAASDFHVRPIPLPGASERGIAMDYLAFDPATKQLWVPAGNTGAVDVLDTTTGKMRQIGGLPTAELTSGERKRVVGPSSASVGDGVVYVGNRADSTICAFGSRSLARVRCGRVDSMPDGVSYVAPTREVWVTTPRDRSIRVLDAQTLQEKTKLTFDGDPEGYAVDARHGRFLTNLEDRDETLAVDLRTRKVVARWKSGCGEAGPRGMAMSPRGELLFVACTDKVETFSTGKAPALLSSAATGSGVDSIDYAPATRLLYAGAARSGDLTIVAVDRAGRLQAAAHVVTAAGARNGVLASDGTLYLAHSPGSELLAVSAK